MAHKNYSSLKSAILGEAKKSLSTKVAPVIAKKMSDNVKEEVYAKYNPIEYKDRRMDSGGLSDVDNIKDYITDSEDGSFVMRMTNETKALNSTAILAPLIEEGQGWAVSNGYGLYHDKIASYSKMMQYNPSNFTPYYEPRRFIHKTKLYVKDNKQVLVSIVKKDMSR